MILPNLMKHQHTSGWFWSVVVPGRSAACRSEYKHEDLMEMNESEIDFM